MSLLPIESKTSSYEREKGKVREVYEVYLLLRLTIDQSEKQWSLGKEVFGFLSLNKRKSYLKFNFKNQGYKKDTFSYLLEIIDICEREVDYRLVINRFPYQKKGVNYFSVV